ncbi:MAG: chemotaxis protein CheW [Anaerovoracaceae bacterium]
MANEEYMIMSEEEALNEEEVEATKKYLAFVSDGLEYAIDADYVNEIIMNNSITRLPKVPHFICGIINLRGQIFPIMDIRLRMGRTKTEFTDDTCIIVTEINEIPLGILVDRVTQMVDLAESQISTPPLGRQQDLVTGIARLQERVLLIISAEELLLK